MHVQSCISREVAAAGESGSRAVRQVRVVSPRVCVCDVFAGDSAPSRQRRASRAPLTGDLRGVTAMALYYLNKIRWLIEDVWSRYIAHRTPSCCR